MPFTLAHPAAVLPFRRFCPGRLNFVALVLGSISPDFFYFLSFWNLGAFAHTILGSIIVSLPVCLISYLVLRYCSDAIAELLFEPFDRALLAGFYVESHLGSLLASFFIGIWSHIIWDSFTHAHGWFVDRIPLLQTPINILNAQGVMTYSIFQYGSSALGLLILALWYQKGLSKELNVPIKITARKLLRWIVFLTLPLIIAALEGLPQLLHEPSIGVTELKNYAIVALFRYLRNVTITIGLVVVGRKMRSSLWNKWLIFLTIIFSGATVLSCFGANNDIFELMSHLKMFYFIGLLFLSVMTFSCRLAMWGTIASIFMCLNLMSIGPLYLPLENKKPLLQSQKLSILQLNLWGGKNSNFKSTLDLVQKENPDVIGFSEVTSTWEKTLVQNLKDKYPYYVVHDDKLEPRFGGILLFSRYPLINPVTKKFVSSQRTRIETAIDVANKKVFLVLAHPKVPKPGTTFRNDELDDIAQSIENQTLPAILIGDLNCTPFSAHFDKLLSQTNLKDSERGFGFQPTWSLHWPAPLFPIDHLLHAKEINATKRQIMAPVGSDHSPLLVELSYE